MSPLLMTPAAALAFARAIGTRVHIHFVGGSVIGVLADVDLVGRARVVTDLGPFVVPVANITAWSVVKPDRKGA